MTNHFFDKDFQQLLAQSNFADFLIAFGHALPLIKIASEGKSELENFLQFEKLLATCQVAVKNKVNNLIGG